MITKSEKFIQDLNSPFVLGHRSSSLLKEPSLSGDLARFIATVEFPDFEAFCFGL